MRFQIKYCGIFGYREGEETALMKVGARYYDPKIGRWIQKDPILSGFNWWVYCENDPVNRVDPLGICPICRTELPYPECSACRGGPYGREYEGERYPSTIYWFPQPSPPQIFPGPSTPTPRPPKVGYRGSPRDILPSPIPEWLELFKYFISKIIDFVNKRRDWFSRVHFPGFGGGHSSGYGLQGVGER